MKIWDEMSADMDFSVPRLIISERSATVENVRTIVSISDSSLTVQNGRRFVTIRGEQFVIKEIFEGRLLIEGTIQGVEFFGSSGGNKDRGL